MLGLSGQPSCVCLGAPVWIGLVLASLPFPHPIYFLPRHWCGRRQTPCQLQSRLTCQEEETDFWGCVGIGYGKGAVLCGLSSNEASLAGGGTASREQIYSNPLPGAEPRGPWGTGMEQALRPCLLTRAALLQLLHCHRLARWWWVLHTAQQRLHEAWPIGWADANMVPWLVLEPLLASTVQAYQDRGPAGVGDRGQLQGAGGRMWEEEGRGQVGDVFLTWTCCFAGFPLRGLWLGTSSVCARGSGLGGGK